MKKYFNALITFLFCCLLLGCQTKPISEKQEPPSFVDGTYMACTKYHNTFGNQSSLAVTIKNGILTKVDFNENLKYPQSEAEPSFIDKKKLYHNLASMLISQQNPNKIDIVTGATLTSNTYKTLAVAIFNEVLIPQKRSTDTIVVNTFNWEYTVLEKNVNPDGSQLQLSIKFDGDKILSLSCDELLNGARRSTGLFSSNELKSLCEQTLSAQTLEPVENVSVNPNKLKSYNDLLLLIKEIRSTSN